MARNRPTTLGALRQSGYRPRSVKDEMRQNLIAALRERRPLFPGIIGYEKTVIPRIVNAILARHDLILLGLRGQAKTRIARQLVALLDEEMPVLDGFPLNEDPLAPITRAARELLDQAGDDAPVQWVGREERYREKLATPDVTIADLIGDIDPIKAANKRLDYSSEEAIHYGIIPRTNRGIFCINELPDLATRIQVGLLNIMEERDVQIRGFPVRLPLDIVMVYTANPEDYTNRGTIITPLKDRIQSQVLTHYPTRMEDALRITAQEAWVERGGEVQVRVPDYLLEAVEEVAFQARRSEFLDQGSGVSARLPITLLENVISNAERRGLLHGEAEVCARPVDFQPGIAAITGKVELVYEGEQQGALNIAQHLVGNGLKEVFDRRLPNAYAEGVEPPDATKASGAHVEQASFGPYRSIIKWFAGARTVDVDDEAPTAVLAEALRAVDGLEALARRHFTFADEAVELPAAMEFVLEGLHQSRLLARDEIEGGVQYGDMLGSMFKDLDLGTTERDAR
jgi:magnesium chelatase subunit I